MAVRYLDGARLRRSAAAAARWVSQRQENLNGINVFPVADGDTGTNLAVTLVSAVERSRTVPGRGLGAVSRALAEGALLGACGNSGAILAQFFEGFAGAVEGSERAAGGRLAVAVSRANSAAQSALSHPREGTMLTVMRAWSERFAARGGSDGADLVAAFRDALATARDSLARTPRQLKELARAGVVDAGAQGFVYFLEGILHFAEGRLAGSLVDEGPRTAPIERAAVPEDPTAITFRFCTECLVEGEVLDLGMIKVVIGRLGDSLVVAGSPRRVRIHLHTDQPETVFALARSMGRVVSTKADDMRLQHAARFARGGVVVVTDSAADLPVRDMQQLRIHTVPLRVLIGDSIYLDKETLDPDEVYERLRRGEKSVRTSQPPPGDYAALYRYLLEHYGAIVVLSLSGALSGTAETARRAARTAGEGRVTVVDTGAASIGQGLVVHAAAQAASRGGTVDEVVAAATRARGRVRFLFAVPTVEYLERGGRVGGWKAKLARRLGLALILRLPAGQGRPCLAGVAPRRHVYAAGLAGARRAIARESSPPERVWIAHAGAPAAAEDFRATLAATVGDGEVEVLEVGPVLGSHAGPGAVAVAWLGAETAP